MIHLIIDYCCVEHKPKEESEFYQFTKAALGEKVADFLTYEVETNPFENANWQGMMHDRLPGSDSPNVPRRPLLGNADRFHPSHQQIHRAAEEKSAT